MTSAELLADAFGRVRDTVHAAVAGLSAEQLAYRIDSSANSIGWLVWHLTRVQDHHVSHLLDEEQEWVTGHWAHRFGLEPEADNTGYGHTADEVAAVRPESASALLEYYAAVAARTDSLLQRLVPADLDRVVDERWDPPVTLGVRLVSVADDDIQHAGQAAYARGLLDARAAG